MARIEIFRGQARRRWSDEEKRQLVAETFMPGATVHAVAQRHGVNISQLFTWRKRTAAISVCQHLRLRADVANSFSNVFSWRPPKTWARGA
jgi:transposase-like protein